MISEIYDEAILIGIDEKQLKEVLLEICNLLDVIKPSKISYRNQIKMIKDRPGHDYRYAINPEKINKELGWKPKVNFKSGLEKTIKWYLHNLKIIE